MATSKDFLEKCLLNNNIQAAIAVVRSTEGTSAEDGYNYMFTSSPNNDVRFTDMSTHPNIKHNANGYVSDAAGAFQIMYKTFTWLCDTYGFLDFSEHTQNLMFCAILDGIGCLTAVCNGLILSEKIMEKLSGQWASLPYSKYGQPTHSIADVRATYLGAGGSIGGLA